MQPNEDIRLTVRPAGMLLVIAAVLLVLWLIGTDLLMADSTGLLFKVMWFVTGPAMLLFTAGLGSVRIETLFVPGSPVFYRTHTYFFFIKGKRQELPLERLSSIELRHPDGNLSAANRIDGGNPFLLRHAFLGILFVYLIDFYRPGGPYELYANMEGYRYILARSSNREGIIEWGQYLAWLTGRRLE